MKISKFEALKIFSKHIIKKFFNNSNSDKVDLNLVATSMSLAFNVHVPKFKSLGIMDDNERIVIEKLREELIKIFNITPIINFPFNGTTLSVKKEDVIKLLEDLEKHSDIDDIIYLGAN